MSPTAGIGTKKIIGGEDNLHYFNRSHWWAIDGALGVISRRGGLVVISGPAGSGKTTVMRAIREQMPDQIDVVNLPYPNFDFKEFVGYLNTALRVEQVITEAKNPAHALRKFLIRQAEHEENTVVFIDDAQELREDVLRMLPKINNLGEHENGNKIGAQFVLISSRQLPEQLDLPEFHEVREALSGYYQLANFSPAELDVFLKRKLAPIARMSKSEPITPEAVQLVGIYTGGNPRLVSKIVSHAMLFAAEKPNSSINAQMVDEAAEALMMLRLAKPFAPEPTYYSQPTKEFDAATDKFYGHEHGNEIEEGIRATLEQKLKRHLEEPVIDVPQQPRPQGDKKNTNKIREHVEIRRASSGGSLRGLKMATFAGLFVVLMAGAYMLKMALFDSQREVQASVATPTVQPTRPEQGAQLGAGVSVARDAAEQVDTRSLVLDIADDSEAAIDDIRQQIALDREGSALKNMREQIPGLMAQAALHLKENRIIEPQGLNAYELYRVILEVEPQNIKAWLRIAEISNIYDALAVDAQKAGSEQQASYYFNVAASVRDLRSLPEVTQEAFEQAERN